MKHTPGPWKVVEHEGDHKYGRFTEQMRSYVLESEKRANMAIMEAYKFEDDPDVWDEVRANANLIAAAPELLEVLESLYTDATDREETTDDSGQEYDDWRAVRLAIAKAKGEKS